MRRRHHFASKKSCYYCGASLDVATREHAPPKMMFAAFQCDRITVPSCDAHNSSKSHGDRAIVTSIALGAMQTLRHFPASDCLTDDVRTALMQLQPNMSQAADMVELRPLLEDPPPGLEYELPYTNRDVKVRSWIRQLTAALVWNITGKYDAKCDWDNAWAWSPGFVPGSQPLKTHAIAETLRNNQNLSDRLDTLDWVPGWSAVPKPYPRDIFRFSVALLPATGEFDDKSVAFHHRFYNGISEWYCMFSASAETLADVRETCAES